jgi:hypothetical protein
MAVPRQPRQVHHGSSHSSRERRLANPRLRIPRLPLTRCGNTACRLHLPAPQLAVGQIVLLLPERGKENRQPSAYPRLRPVMRNTG